MSYTGTYKYNKETGKVERISESTPNICVFDVYVPDGGYFSENLCQFVESRKHKREILKRLGLREMNDKLTEREL